MSIFDENIVREVGHAIASERERAKVSQSDLAERIGVSKAFLCDVEHGRRYAGIDRVHQIVDTLGSRGRAASLILQCGCCGASLIGIRRREGASQ